VPALRVGFAGTPVFAAEALAAILEAGFAVPLVLTQPDRPGGRGMKLQASPVKQRAAGHGIPVLQPPSLKTESGRAEALSVRLDVLVVAAYGLILPPAVLAWPRYGGLNIHASKLPRWRGAAPIQRALLAGDVATGVTIMQMDAGLDTGPVIDTIDIPIAPRETAGTLTAKLAAAGAAAIVAVLERLAREGLLPATAQPTDGATYAAKIGRAEAELDWTQPASVLDRAVRAFDPVPGAFTLLGGESTKVWSADPVAITQTGSPGTVLAIGADGLDVACGAGVLRLRTVQPAGGKRMSGAAFAAGRGLAPGARFGAATGGGR
jgi:methionyl-tRNA formyltransferase